MRFIRIAACLTGLWLPGIHAQQQVLRKEPVSYSVKERTSRVEVRPPGIRLGLRKSREVALAPLGEAEAHLLAEPGTRLIAGIQRKLAPHLLAAGTWVTTSGGERIWRMGLRSPGARGIRVEFVNFNAGSGQVWVYDGSHVAGPYTGSGPRNDGHFFSETVESGAATVEYDPAPGDSAPLEPPFELRSIVHQQRTALDFEASTKDPADYCEIDANCYTEWQPSMSSVGLLGYVDSGLSYFCSGSLLATRDNSLKPYFLTAGHCINNEAAARTAEVYWTYQTSSCNGTPPASRDSSTRSTGGAHLIDFAAPQAGDFSLILLANIPSGVTFAGWDANDPPVTADLTAIHHPSASWKRISFGTRTPDAIASLDGATLPANLFLQVTWNKGRVEHGSSGSPLFTAPGVIVGSLSYGETLSDGTVCTIDPATAGYSRFSNTYSQIKAYLENLPAAAIAPDQSLLSFTKANGAAPAAQTVKLTTQSTGKVNYQLRPDESWIQVSSQTGTLSATSPAAVYISVDSSKLPTPGQYAGTVSILTSSADPVFINVTAIVKADRSNVTPSITPNPVAQTGGLWSFQIQLAETAGVATRLTALKFNGADYSSAIGNWFGDPHIAASGTITAPLSGAGRFPAGTQYFEFWGVDDVTGTPWYRVATVSFR